MKTIYMLILLLISVQSYSQKKQFCIKPEYAKIQFAGNIGFVSVGFGYKFFREKISSELLYGYVPKSISKAENINTIALKNTFSIYDKKIKNIILSPIAGFTANYETGNNSFLKLPDKYPKGYYSSNAFHFTFFTGCKVYKNFNNSKTIKGIDIYYEFGTVDTYLWYAVLSKEVKINRIFSSSIGVNFYL